MAKIVVAEYKNDPPYDFKAIVLQKCEPMSGVFGLRFEGNKLVADMVPNRYSHTGLVFYASLVCLEDGYKAALGPTKPYGLKYGKIKFPSMDREPRVEKEVIEWFVTREEAHNRRMELNQDVRFRLEQLLKSRPVLSEVIMKLSEEFHPKIVHSEDKEHHF